MWDMRGLKIEITCLYLDPGGASLKYDVQVEYFVTFKLDKATLLLNFKYSCNEIPRVWS